MPHNRPSFLQTIAAISLLATIIFGPVNKYRTSKLYEKVAPYAVQRFGDKKAPLTDAEQEEWYRCMGVKEGKKPGYFNLKSWMRYEKKIEEIERINGIR